MCNREISGSSTDVGVQRTVFSYLYLLNHTEFDRAIAWVSTGTVVAFDIAYSRCLRASGFI